VLAWTNVEIVGRGVLEPDDEAIGLVAGWPPDTRHGRLDLRALQDGSEWEGQITPILGIRTTAPKSGLRGVVVSWIDGEGNRGSETFDFAGPDVRAGRMRSRLKWGRLAVAGAGLAQPLISCGRDAAAAARRFGSRKFGRHARRFRRPRARAPRAARCRRGSPSWDRRRPRARRPSPPSAAALRRPGACRGSPPAWSAAAAAAAR
jgi:hypothetical protein